MQIASIKTKNGINIRPNNLTIVIGANDTVKSTFIREIYIRATNIPIDPSYRWRWIDAIELLVKDEHIAECRDILKRSIISKFDGKKDTYTYLLADWRNDQGNPAGGNQTNVTINDYAAISRISPIDLANHKQFRTPFFIYAGCESRLMINSPSGLAPIHDRAPDVLNIFYRREDLFKELTDSIDERFNYNLILLNHAGTQLELGTSSIQKPDLGNVGDKNEVYRRTEEWKKLYFTPIQESGHGLRSMIRILEALLDTDKKIKLIDEPEMHLHPSQKLWIGGKIAELSTDENSQTIVATHDAHVLQGILDKRPKATILRFASANGKRAIYQWLLPQEPNPTTDTFRTDFLSGLFHNYSVAVEGESDRLFYNEMMQDCPELKNLDVAFVPCRGGGGTLNMARLVTAVNQPSSFILDLDVIFEAPNVIRNIINAVSNAQELPKLTKIELLMQQLRNEKPDEKWKSLISYTNKGGPGECFIADHGDLLLSTLNELAGYGVFLVPNGGLESWAPALKNTIRFPEMAPGHIRSKANLHTSIKEFLQGIGQFLTKSESRQ